MQRYTTFGLNMPQLTILAGIAMTLLGLGFFVHTDYLTALFPTLFGLLLISAGIVSVVKPNLNALSMHVAVITSLVTTILGLATALFGTWTTTTSLIEQLLMSSIATAHLSACIASFNYGKARFSGDSQTCGIDDATSIEKKRNPGPASVVAISVD
jgi:uncharacterized membrane protein HdeD (DUF308 family)